MQPHQGSYGYDQQPPVAGYGGSHPATSAYGQPHGPPRPYPPSAAAAYHHQQSPYGAGSSAGGVVGGGGATESDIFYATKNFMGRIIGPRGVTINDLQRRSGCNIQINQNVPPGQDCEVSIRGARQGIEMVKQMLREIIETGPNHPYAGGNSRKFSVNCIGELRYMLIYIYIYIYFNFFLFVFQFQSIPFDFIPMTIFYYIMNRLPRWRRRRVWWWRWWWC